MDSGPMSTNRKLFNLPKYRGPLAAAPWSGLVLSDELEEALKAAALRGCPCCEGLGYTVAQKRAHPCACINRRSESAS